MTRPLVISPFVLYFTVSCMGIEYDFEDRQEERQQWARKNKPTRVESTKESVEEEDVTTPGVVADTH